MAKQGSNLESIFVALFYVRFFSLEPKSVSPTTRAHTHRIDSFFSIVSRAPLLRGLTNLFVTGVIYVDCFAGAHQCRDYRLKNAIHLTLSQNFIVTTTP
jgi:hypothetical protein